MSFRPPTWDDADAIVALLCACDIADYGAPDYDHDALREEWADLDVERDAFFTDGAYGHLSGNDIRAWVHPHRRGGALGGALLDLLEGRARERGLDHLDWQLARADEADRALVVSRGYEFVLAYADMRLPDSAVEALPSGDGVRVYDEARDEAAAQSLMERAFAGGFGRVDSLESIKAGNPDTSLWFVIDAEDGSLAGALRAELRPAGFIQGYIRAIAVEAEHRGRGLAARLIGAASRELLTRGVVEVRLHVRSSNPRALELYERLGFRGGWDVDEYRLQLNG